MERQRIGQTGAGKGASKIIMIPGNHEYLRKLGSYLEKDSIAVRFLKPFHYSAPVNIAMIPLLRLRGYRIVHVHWLYIFPFAWVMKFFCHYCHLLGIKVVWEMHNIISHGGKAGDVEMSRWFYNNCDGIIFHSKADIERAKELLSVGDKQAAAVVYHANFINSYKNEVSKEQARTLLGIPPGKQVLLCFGQIRKNRGYEYLMKAAADLEKVFLIIAGEIIDRNVYRELTNQQNNANMKVIGKWISNDEIQLYFNSCDAVVLPYTEVTTSGVVPLAYSFARPVIVSAIGGIKEVVPEGVGFLVPPRNAEDLRKAIVHILEADHDAMGKGAYSYASRELTWERTAEEIKKLYLGISCPAASEEAGRYEKACY